MEHELLQRTRVNLLNGLKPRESYQSRMKRPATWLAGNHHPESWMLEIGPSSLEGGVAAWAIPTPILMRVPLAWLWCDTGRSVPAWTKGHEVRLGGGTGELDSVGDGEDGWLLKTSDTQTSVDSLGYSFESSSLKLSVSRWGGVRGR